MRWKGATWFVALIVSAASSHGAVIFELHGILSASGMRVKSQPSWLEGGFGRLDAGASASNKSDTAAFASAQIGADAFLTSWLSLHANTVARSEPGDDGGRRAGVIEAFADVTPIDTDHNRLRLRAGMFFLPTSRENVDRLWSSPYTITLSAWNTWIGEEFRPVGAELEYRNTNDAGNQLSLAAGTFKDNDTSGTLLAWRGWSMGRRLTTYGEVLPLPPLFSLSDPRYFGGRQRSDGTKPFGSDLDGRFGWTGRLRWQIPQKFTIQLASANNRGDRELYHSEYAWYTDFLLLGTDWRIAEHSTIAAEAARGETGMGLQIGPRVDSRFQTAYVLFSQEFGRHRMSVRGETFRVHDLDHTSAEDETEHGNAVTLAYFFTPMDHLRLGAELVDLRAKRAAAVQSGFDGNTDGRTATVEARWQW
ncbi:MAG: hypothetical protein ACXVIJ_15175 [Thermoanaerobaculia bacterium]